MDDGIACLDRLDGLELDQTFVIPAKYYIQVPAWALEGIAKSRIKVTTASLGGSHVLNKEILAGQSCKEWAEYTALIL